jgi:hypothetical protein
MAERLDVNRIGGIVERVELLQFGHRRGNLKYAWIRGDDGRRYFLHRSACGTFQPMRFDRVMFTADGSDPRGLRAFSVQIVAKIATPDSDMQDDLTVRCSECAGSFVWTAAERRWYFDHRLQAPKKCEPCRKVVGARMGWKRDSW